MIGQACGPIFATTIVTTFTDPVTKVVNGNPIVVANVPSPTAFNIIFAIGIGLTPLVAEVGLPARNYKFEEK